jgi:gliding motility-associated-like protein
MNLEIRKDIKRYRRKWLVYGISVLSMISLNAQIGNFGNTYIGGQDEVATHTSVLYLDNSASGSLPGILGTERRFTPGFMSFVGVSSAQNGSNSQHIDGYAKSFMDGAMLFPLGDNGIYRPAAISNASVFNPTSAAYYGVNPTIAITSSLRGGNEPLLPSGVVYPISVKSNTITSIDSTGYWDINGSEKTRISLTWITNTALSQYLSDLKKLTIVGWSSTINSWVEIPSEIDFISIFGTKSSLSDGSITSELLSPNEYDVFTIGFKKEVEDAEIPNYFSPNGDGANDKWLLPQSLSDKYPQAKVMIYNRWGNIVWRSVGKYNNDWAGEHYDTNDPLPDGVYYYLLELDPLFKTTKTGFIEIMRQ